jgi:hypothetical protein
LGVRDDRFVAPDIGGGEEAWREDTCEPRFDVLTLSLVVGAALCIVGEHNDILGWREVGRRARWSERGT